MIRLTHIHQESRRRQFLRLNDFQWLHGFLVRHNEILMGNNKKQGDGDEDEQLGDNFVGDGEKNID